MEKKMNALLNLRGASGAFLYFVVVAGPLIAAVLAATSTDLLGHILTILGSVKSFGLKMLSLIESGSIQ